MRKRIWAVGASVRALAQSLAAAGHEVVAADLFNDLDLQQIAETQRITHWPGDLLKLADTVAADAWLYTGGLENFPSVVDQLSQRLPLLGNAGTVLIRVRNVAVLKATLAQAGFRMPDTAAELLPEARGRWLRKNNRSSGGLRVAVAAPGALLRKGDCFQQFIEGTVYGASYVATADGAILLGIAEQLTDCGWTNAPPFHYAGSLGPIALQAGLQAEVLRLGKTVAREFCLRGWFGIDFIVDASGQLWVLEVNPRYTASMELLERSASQSIAPWHLAACSEEPCPAAQLESGSDVVGKAVLYAPRETVVTSKLIGRLRERGEVADVPTDNCIVAAGAPLISLLATARSREACFRELQQHAAQLEAEAFENHGA